MPETHDHDVTRLLAAVAGGDGDARERLLAIIYDELRRLARRQAAVEPTDVRRQPTTLVHEAYLRLFGPQAGAFANRKHFFVAAAKVMRDICVDDARKRGRVKRGAGQRPAALPDDVPAADARDPAEVQAVAEALEQLEREDPRKAQVVGLRYYVGMTIEETAEALELSPRTVNNDWRVARAWLHRALNDQ